MRQWSQSHTEVLNGGVLVLLGIAIWLYAGTFPDLDEGYPGPALFPRLISTGFTLAGLALLIKHLPKLIAGESSASSVSGPTNVETRGYSLLAGISLVVLFPFLSDWIGFLPTLGISILGIALLFRINYLQSGLIAVGTLGTIYLTFNVLLGVPL